MMRYFLGTPVGMAGLIVLGLGFVLFFAALLAARERVARSPDAPIARSAPATRLWIVVQGIGIGIAGLGPIQVAIDPAPDDAIAKAIVVALLMGGAVWLFDASSRAMGKNWAIVARTRSDQTLVQTGPFAWVRNPIYVALALFMFAMAIAFGHARNLVAATPLYALGTWMRVAHEERLLRAQFGAAYDDYAARVKRFVPGLL